MENILRKKRKRRKSVKPPREKVLYRRRVKDAKLAVLGLKRTVPRVKRRRLALPMSSALKVPRNKYKVTKRQKRKSLKPIDAAKRRMKRALDIARLDGVLNWRASEPRPSPRKTKFWRSRQKKAALLL